MSRRWVIHHPRNIAILAGTLLGVATLLASYYLVRHEHVQWLAQTRHFKASLTMASSLDPYIKAHEALTHGSSWKGFLTAKEPGESQAMSTALKAALVDALGESAVIEGFSERPAEELREIQVSIKMSVAVDQLATAIQKIESSYPYLQIDVLTVQAPNIQQKDTNPNLTVNATVSAFALPHRDTRG